MALDCESVRFYGGERVCCLPNGEFLHPAGTGVVLRNLLGKAKFWAAGDPLRQVNLVQINPAGTIITVVEKRLHVTLFVYAADTHQIIQRLPDVVPVEAADMAFSRDGTVFAVLGGPPQHSLVLFNVDPQQRRFTPLCALPNATAFLLSSVSFNPRNSLDLCASGGGHVVFFRAERSPASILPTEGKVTSALTRPTVHAWLPTGEVAVGTKAGEVLGFAGAGASVGELRLDTGSQRAVVAIQLCANHALVATEDGAIRFCSQDFFQCRRTIFVPTDQLATMSFTAEWHSLVLGSRDGLLLLLHLPGYQTPVLPDRDFQEITPKVSVLARGFPDGLVGVSHLERDTVVVSVAKSGSLRVTNYVTNTEIAEVHVGAEPVAIHRGCDYSRTLIAVASASGTLRIVNVSDPTAPTVTFRERLFEERPVWMQFDPTGSVLAVACESRIAFLEVRGGGVVELLAYTSPPESSPVCAAAWFPEGRLLLTAHRSGDLMKLSLPSPGMVSPETRAVPLEGVLVNAWRLELPVRTLVVGCAFEDGFHVFAQSADKETKVYAIDATLPLDRKDRETKPCKPQTAFRDHDKPGTRCELLRNKYFVSAASDGRIAVRDVSALLQKGASWARHSKDVLSQTALHVPLLGGVADFTANGDATRVVSCGADGTLAVWTFGGKVPPPPAAPFRALDPSAVVAPDAEEPMLYVAKQQRLAREVERMNGEAVRRETLAVLAALRADVEKVRIDNENAAEDEKVPLSEFLIEEDRNEFLNKVEESVEEMTATVHRENVRRDYIIDILKRECWDVMDKKLTPLVAMQTPHLETHNFHTRREDRRDLAVLKKLKFLRRVEIVDRQKRGVKELEDIREKAPPPPEDGAPPADGTPAAAAAAGAAAAGGADVSATLTVGGSDESSSRAAHSVPFEELYRGMSDEQSYVEAVKPFLYPPLLVFTRHRAITQITLLKAQSAALKASFNAQFEELAARKKADASRIDERNMRCRQVLKELEESHPLFVVAPAPLEQPALLLKVSDDEVLADKSTDPEEKLRRLQEGKEKERWLARHGNDDSSERALKMWMDGRLEKEDRVLDINIEKPEFADETSEKFVQPEDRTEEQHKTLKDYEKRLAKRMEEVTARRRALQAEFAMLQRENVETAKTFDKAVQRLLMTRLGVSQKCFEVDLQQVKLGQSVVLLGERVREARVLEQQRAAASSRLVRASRSTQAAQAVLNGKREKLQQVLNDEKHAEKNMRSMPPFSDSEEHAELLYKLYMKRKPRRANKPAEKKAKGGKIEVEAASADPFAFIEREEEAKRKQREAEDTAPLARIDKPDAIPDPLWDAFLRYRQDRVNAEKTIKRMSDEIAELEKEESRLLGLEDAARHAAEAAIRAANDCQNASIRDTFDVDELYVFRQGQVEVEQAPVVTDYADACLIDASRIERLNELIRASGAAKVALMRDIGEKKKETRTIDWEIEHLSYTMASLEMEYRHLHTLRVTKQMQEFINGGGEDHNEQQRKKLLQKIEHVRESMAEKIEQRQAQMRKLRLNIREKDLENRLLMEQVQEAKCVVDDRKAIHDLQSSEMEKEQTQRLMRDMRVTRKLEDVARAQQEEMVALKKEIDRLRERTFPSFAVVSKRVVGNPDEV